MVEDFKALVPGMGSDPHHKLSRPERMEANHFAEKAPPFVITREDNDIIIDARKNTRIKVHYGLAGRFELGHQTFCRDDEGRMTKC